MSSPDADIPQAIRGDLTLIIADAGGSRVTLRHRLRDGGIDDPQFRRLDVALRINGISADTATMIEAALDAAPEGPLPSRAALLRHALRNTP